MSQRASLPSLDRTLSFRFDPGSSSGGQSSNRPPKARGGSHPLFHGDSHAFSSGSCEFLLILWHLGAGGKRASRGGCLACVGLSAGPPPPRTEARAEKGLFLGRRGEASDDKLQKHNPTVEILSLRFLSNRLAFRSCFHRITPWRRFLKS